MKIGNKKGIIIKHHTNGLPFLISSITKFIQGGSKVKNISIKQRITHHIVGFSLKWKSFFGRSIKGPQKSKQGIISHPWPKHNPNLKHCPLNRLNYSRWQRNGQRCSLKKLYFPQTFPPIKKIVTLKILNIRQQVQLISLTQRRVLVQEKRRGNNVFYHKKR